MSEVSRTFNTWTIIEDELPYMASQSHDTETWLRSVLTDGAAIVFNAPRPLFGDERIITNAPRGFFVAVLHPNDERGRELVWENHRQDATILRLVTVEEARRLADTVRSEGYDNAPDIWERVWREAFYDYFRHGEESVECFARY